MILDVSKTGGHFSGASEMYGTFISGIELDNSTSINNSTMINGRKITESHNTSNSNSKDHMTHESFYYISL